MRDSGSLYQGDYLRVLTPETTDGINLKYHNGKPVIKESHLAFTETAIRNLEQENKDRPDHLKHKYEHVQA